MLLFRRGTLHSRHAGGLRSAHARATDPLAAHPQAASPRPDRRTVEQAWLDAECAKVSQTAEETAEGEAFFDNCADAEDAVLDIHDEATCAAPPALRRQGAFGTPRRNDSAPLPQLVKPKLKRQHTTAGKQAYAEGATYEEAVAIDSGLALPADCDMDADFGAAGDDGWGSE